MKTLLLVFAVFLGFAAEAAHQYIQCAPQDRDSEDRVVVAIYPEKRATLFMSSNLNTDENSGVINMAFDLKASDADAQNFIWVGENTSSVFRVTIPREAFWKSSNDLRIVLDLAKKDGQLQFSDRMICFSRLY